jgi:MFS family permease
VLLLPLLAVTTTDRLWIVYVVAALQSCLARLASPAKAALIPSLVPREQLTAANSLNAVSDNLARLVGSPIGGLAIQLLGLVGVVVVDAATFLVSALLSAQIRVPKQVAAPRANEAEAPRASLVADWLDGLRTIRRTPPLPAILSIGALSQVAQGIFVVLFVVFVLRELNGTGGDVGLIRGMQAIGGVIGGIVVGTLSRRLGPRGLISWGFVVFGLIALATWNAPRFTTAIGLYVGLFIAAIAGAMGAANVVVVEPNAYRRGLIEALGATAVAPEDDVVGTCRKLSGDKIGFDVAFEASGVPAALPLLLDALRREATVVAVGIPGRPIELDVAAYLIKKGLTFTGSFGRALWGTWEQIAELVASGKLDLSKFVTHRLPLSALGEAIGLLSQDSCKVLLIPALPDRPRNDDQ